MLKHVNATPRGLKPSHIYKRKKKSDILRLEETVIYRK